MMRLLLARIARFQLAFLVAVLALTAVLMAQPVDITSQLMFFLTDLRAGKLGVNQTISTIQVGDGTVAAPSILFASEVGNGLTRQGAGITDWVAGNVDLVRFQKSGTSAILTLFGTGSQLGFQGDTTLFRNGAGILQIQPTGASTELQVANGNGGFISAVKMLSELTTIAAAATTNTVIQLPANAVILAVSVRVVTVIPTAATFTVTSATPAKTWNTVAVPVAAGTTDPGTAPGPSFQTTASVITFTPNLSPAAATGQVRVTAYFYQVTPSTS